MQEGQVLGGQPAPANNPGFVSQPTPVMQTKDDQVIQWTASEFIEHTKSLGWYMTVLLITLGLAVAAYFWTDWLTVGVTLFVGLIFIIMASRKPRELPYSVHTGGIQIDKKFYPFSDFKSFSIVQEGGVESIWLLPLQRFMPGLSIYFSPEEGQRIVDRIGSYLPFEPRQQDALERFLHRIGF